VGYVRPKWAKEPAIGAKRPSKSLRRRVKVARVFEISGRSTFNEHFFNGLLRSLGATEFAVDLAHWDQQALDV
jgi:hypothetical protein